MPWGSWRGVPCQVQPGGGVPCQVQLGGYPGRGGTLAGVGGTLAGGVPWQGGTLPGGGTQVGQQKEYSLHGGRYASCVHAGGLSCYILPSEKITFLDRRSEDCPHNLAIGEACNNAQCLLVHKQFNGRSIRMGEEFNPIAI